MAASEHRAFCTVLHDVAPHTWESYRPFIDLLDALGVALTLLLVPDLHGRGRLDRYPAFCRAMEHRLERGDELVLHGYYHCDDLPLRPTPSDWVRRRLLTHEAEFLPLPPAVAQQRLESGLGMFAGLGWPVHGFVAPGWMLGPDTEAQLRALDFRYTSTFTGLIDLQRERRHRVPTLVWSPRPAWRNQLSSPWNRARLWRWRTAPCLRLGIHPPDLEQPLARRFWLDSIARLYTERASLTKLRWLELNA